MTWDPRDTRLSVPADARESLPAVEPAGPAMIPTLAVLHGLDDWLDEGFTFDNLSAAEQEDARLAGLVPESQWAVRRRLMTRGIVERE